MAQWYIGIDETGTFNHLDANDKSNVSAVVTQKSPEEIFEILKKVACERKYNVGKFTKPWAKMNAPDKHQLLKYFHGCKQQDKFDALDALLENDTLIDCVIQSEGRPFVTVNPQQWWIAAVLGVVQKFFTMGKCKRDDNVHIEIATRDDGSLGLRFKPKKEVFEQYNSFLAKSIERELRRSLQNHCKFLEVRLQPAGYSELPTLADQVSNIIKPDYQARAIEIFSNNADLLKRITPYKTSPHNASLGINVNDLINKGNLQGAIEAFLTEVLSGSRLAELSDEQSQQLNDIVAKAQENGKVWQTIIDSCETVLWNRGNDGNAINRASKIIVPLSKLTDNIPSDDLRNKFFRLYAEYLGCAGKWDNELFEKIEKSFQKGDSSFTSPLNRWAYYLNIFSAKAQTYFNTYRFGELETDYKKILDVQDQLSALKSKFPFTIASEDPDQNYCEIYSTMGQELAFKGKYDEAIELFKNDFEKAPQYHKSMYASFLAVVYFKQRDLAHAKEWHEKQVKDTSKTNDQWLMLDKLRISALAADLRQEAPYTVPPIDIWHNEGDYPWPLLLKWSAFVEYTHGNKTCAAQRLENACNKLTKSEGFTIRTLALSVIAMLIYIAQDGSEKNEATANLEKYRKDYTSLLEKCSQETSSFKHYVENHPEFRTASKKAASLWDAANLLPFNFA